MEDSAYPKIVFECLLDQIEKLQLENHRLVYGDADEGFENGLVVDEHGMSSFSTIICFINLSVVSGMTSFEIVLKLFTEYLLVSVQATLLK